MPMKSSYEYIKDYFFYVWISFLVILFILNIFTINWNFLRWSIIDYKNIQSDEFDWTVYPIEFVPNPFLLTFDQRKQNFNNIDSKFFIKTPIYNPEIFWKNPDSLKPWTKEYEETITQRLLYTIPYMSTYKFDYKEYSWSHTWIDIIVPKWTPIRSIANWVVVDVKNNSANFWNYVVVRHDNVPLPNWETWNIYALFWHMSSISVVEWQKVNKWFIIWEVWSTWISTTNHLHFQIDLESAPFKPYWPFSANEMKKAKVDFFDAVNIWLGQQDAIKYTINPLKFVNNFLNYSVDISKKTDNISKKEEKDNQKNENNNKNTNTNEEKSIVLNKDYEKNNKFDKNKSELFSNIDSNVDLNSKKDDKLLNSDKDFLLLNNIELALLWNSPIANNIVNNDTKNYDSEIFSSNESIVKNDPKIEKEDYNESIVKNNSNNSNNISNSIISVNSYSNNNSDNIVVVNNNNSIIKTENNSDLIYSSNESKKDLDIQTTYFKDISSDYKYFKELDYFKKNDIINWYSDWTFKPKNTITRSEAIKIISLAYKLKISKNTESNFDDVKANTWENLYINTALESNVIEKLNNNFLPDLNITRVEAIKFITKVSNQDLDKYEDFNIFDVDKSSWKYKYMNYAFRNNFFSLINGEIFPDKELTREEFIYILYKILHS